MNTVSTSRITMDWGNLQFKAKDIIQFGVYLGIGLVAYLDFKADTKMLLEKNSAQITAMQQQITEVKDNDKGAATKTEVFWQNMLNQVNTNTTQIKLIDQRLTFMENNYRR